MVVIQENWKFDSQPISFRILGAPTVFWPAAGMFKDVSMCMLLSLTITNS